MNVRHFHSPRFGLTTPAVVTLVLTMEYFTQTGVEKRDERQLKRAAELCAFMMQNSRFVTYDSTIFRQATDRFVKLLPALEAADAECQSENRECQDRTQEEWLRFHVSSWVEDGKATCDGPRARGYGRGGASVLHTLPIRRPAAETCRPYPPGRGSSV